MFEEPYLRTSHAHVQPALLPAQYYDGHVSGLTSDRCTFTTFSERLVCRVVPRVRSAIRLYQPKMLAEKL